MLKKISIYILSLILMFTMLPNNIVKADDYTQLKGTSVKFNNNFDFKSGINRDVNFSNVAVFADNGVKVHNAARELKVGSPVTVKIPNGFKYMDGSTYDIYVEVSTTKDLSNDSRWICKTVSSTVNGKEYDCLELSPFNMNVWGDDPYVTFDYKIYVLDKDGKDAIGTNNIDLTAGSCWTAVNEGARPWGDDNTIYTNIPFNVLEYKTSLKARNGKTYNTDYWHITNGSYNKLNYFILGHGTHSETVKYYQSTGTSSNVTANVIKGGYLRNSESGSAEMTFGYFLSAAGEDYVGYYDGKAHSINVEASGGTITYSTSQSGAYSSTNPSYTDVGTYTTYYKISGAGYNSNEVKSHTVTIKPLPINVTPTALDKVYDNTTTATLLGGDNKTVLSDSNKLNIKTGVGNESFTICGLTGSFDSANVGYNKTVAVNSTGKQINYENGAKEANYKITINNTKASITKADISGVSATPYVGIYDGQLHNISVTKDGSALTSDYSAQYYSDPSCTTLLTDQNGYKDVKGEYPNVDSYTVYYKVTKNNDSNYNPVTGSSTVTINRRRVDVIPTALSKSKTEDITTEATIVGRDGNSQVSESNPIELTSSSYSQIIDTGTINLYNITGSFSDTEVGNDKPVTITWKDKTVKSSDINVNNYDIYAHNTTASIYSGSAYTSATSYVGVYDGKYHTSTITVKDSNNTDIESSKYTITYYDSDPSGENSSATQSTSYTSSGSIDANTTYDNLTAKTIYYKVEFNSSSDGTSTTDSESYTTQIGNFVMMIIPAEVSYTPTALNKEYDGDATATIVGDTDKNAVNGESNKITIKTGITRVSDTNNTAGTTEESFTIYGLTGTFDSADAGDGKVVTVDSSNKTITAVENTGFNASNYHITINNTTAKITAKSITAIATPYDGVYDGNYHGITVKAYDSSNNEVTIDSSEISYYTDENMTTIDELNTSKHKDVTLDDNSDVSTMTVYYKINKANYKDVSGSSTVTIRPKLIEITPKAEDKVYDGNTSATVDDVSESTGIGNESISVTGLSGYFDDPNIGNNKYVTVDTSKDKITINNGLEKDYIIKIYDTNASITNKSDNNGGGKKTEANTPCEEWNHSKNWTWSEKEGRCVYRVGKTSSR